MTDPEKGCWREIVKLAPAGVLFNSDRLILELAARCLAESREKWPMMKAAEKHLLLNVLARLGLSPTDRARLAAVEPAKSNPFADL